MKNHRFLPSYLTVLITIFIASLIGCDIVQQKNQNRPSKSTEQKGSSVTLVGRIAPDFSLLDSTEFLGFVVTCMSCGGSVLGSTSSTE